MKTMFIGDGTVTNNVKDILQENINVEKIKYAIAKLIEHDGNCPSQSVLAVSLGLSIEAVRTCLSNEELKNFIGYYREHGKVPGEKKRTNEASDSSVKSKKARKLNFVPVDNTRHQIYAYICQFSNNGTNKLPSAKKIATHFNITVSAVDKYLNQLAQDGYLTKSAVAYFINSDMIPALNMKDYFDSFNVKKPSFELKSYFDINRQEESSSKELLEQLLQATSLEPHTGDVIDYISDQPALIAYEFKTIVNKDKGLEVDVWNDSSSKPSSSLGCFATKPRQR